MLRITIPGILCAAVLISASTPAPRPAMAQDNLPDLGRASETLSHHDETRLGRQFIRQARQRMDFVDDPELTQYITELGRHIASNSDEPGSAFSFYLIRNDTLNAFAVPGGHIAVHSGLIMATESEAELASVVAHEIAHITQHHLARMIDQTSGGGMRMLGALAAAILLGGEAGQAALVAANASSIEERLEYSRGFEREADGIGLQILARSGYDTRAMPAFFERLQQWSRIYETGAPEFLRTHPITTNRIADTKVRASNFPPADNPDPSDFHHIRAKMRALFNDDPGSAASQFASNLDSGDYDNEHAERYGYAMALSRAGQHDRAFEVIDRLIADNPRSVRYRAARANMLMDAGRYDQALYDFESVHADNPKDLVVGLYYAQALIQTRNYREARQVLKKLRLSHKQDPRIYALLGRAEGEMGDSLASHQYLAEYHYYRYDLAEAKRQLRLAKRYADGNDYAAQSIEAKMKEIQRQMEIYDEEEQEQR